MNAPLRQRLLDFLRDRVSQRTRVPPEEIANDTDLAGIGIRSIDAVLISGQIEDEFQTEVSPVMMLECRTIDEVADHLMELLGER